MFLSSGFQAFLSKPIDIMAMDSVIRRWVRNKDFEKEQEPEISLYSAGHPGEWTIPVLRAIEVPGINAEKAQERFGGDLNVFWDVVKSFARNTPPLLDEIRGIDFSEENMKSYAIVVHGLKSSSRSIGAEILGSKAEALEYAAKAGDLDFVRENHRLFILEADQLLAGINAEINQMAAGNPKPRKKEPAEEVLEDLAQACRTFDIDGVDKAMEELESCEYETGSDLIAWLREKADGMSFKEIAGRLS
jgi:HPt (histidine-containing phosphotransfer) domain-containing protein